MVDGEFADVEMGSTKIGVSCDESIPASANEPVPCSREFQPTWEVVVIVVIVIFASFQEDHYEQLIHESIQSVNFLKRDSRLSESSPKSSEGLVCKHCEEERKPSISALYLDTGDIGS